MELKQKGEPPKRDNPYAAPESAPSVDFDPWDLHSAPHGKRLIAFLVDRALIFGGVMALGALGGVLVEAVPELQQPVGVMNIALGFALPVLYHGLMEGSSLNASVGKLALGLKVVSDQTGEPLSYPHAFGRATARTFISLVGLLNLVVLFSKKHQGLWDMMAKTRVVVR